MFRGSLVALVTPMTVDGEIDFTAWDRLIRFHLAHGTDGLVIAGTTGEGATLLDDEYASLIDKASRFVGGKLPIIAGVAGNYPAAAITRATLAMEAGADGCLVLTPTYIKPTQEGLYQHFSRIAEAIPLPIILYNVPSRTSVDLLPPTVARLADRPNIVAIKEASGKLDRTEEIIERCGNRLAVLSGDDAGTLEIMRAGGQGVISVTANVVPHLVHELTAAMLDQDYRIAMEIDQQLLSLYRALFVETNPIPVKWALNDMGLIPRGIRIPLTPLSDRLQEGVRQVLAQLRLYDPAFIRQTEESS